jgi:hypothetical protein
MASVMAPVSVQPQNGGPAEHTSYTPAPAALPARTRTTPAAIAAAAKRVIEPFRTVAENRGIARLYAEYVFMRILWQL